MLATSCSPQRLPFSGMVHSLTGEMAPPALPSTDYVTAHKYPYPRISCFFFSLDIN